VGDLAEFERFKKKYLQPGGNAGLEI